MPRHATCWSTRGPTRRCPRKPGWNTSALPDLRQLSQFDARLREVATDPEAVREAITSAEALRKSDDSTRLLNYLGSAYRLVSDFASAIACFSESLQRSVSAHDKTREVVALIGLGEALRCADRFADSEAALRTALTLARGTTHEDYALQHLGKCLVDADRIAEGRACLEQALALRQRKGDAELIASTTLALERAESLLRADR